MIAPARRNSLRFPRGRPACKEKKEKVPRSLMKSLNFSLTALTDCFLKLAGKFRRLSRVVSLRAVGLRCRSSVFAAYFPYYCCLYLASSEKKCDRCESPNCYRAFSPERDWIVSRTSAAHRLFLSNFRSLSLSLSLSLLRARARGKEESGGK